MRITDLCVERCGAWRDLTLSLPSAGLSVLYGPNEAGKTTLLRFIRGVLFGFTPPLKLLDAGVDESEARPGVHQASRADLRIGGSIRLDADGARCEVRRLAAAGTGDELSVAGPMLDGSAADRLRKLLGGCDETLFAHVFALGLHELQELATLEVDEVARHIYGMTLGPEARRLLDATGRLHAERERLFAADGRSGLLIDLLRREREADEALRALPDARQAHQQLTARRRAVQDRIDELQKRQTGYHSQLRGHVFLERVYPPWKQVRDCEAELDRLPVVTAFPEKGVQRLDELDEQLDSLRRCRDALRAEADQFREQARGLTVDPAWSRHRATLESLVEQQPWIDEAARQAAAAESRVAALRVELEQQRPALGDWTEERLDALDTSPAAHARLTAAARDYAAARVRWKLVRRRYDRLNKSTRQREADLAAHLAAHGGGSVGETLAAAKSRLAGLEALAGLRLREHELDQRGRSLDEQLARIDERIALPKWVYLVLAVFGAFGVLFAAMGLAAGVTTSVLSGAAYAFIGATCGISAWALKTHFESESRERLAQLEDERRATEVALRETRVEIARLTRDETHCPGRSERPGQFPAPECDQPAVASADDTVTEIPMLSVLHPEHLNPPGSNDLSDPRSRQPVAPADVELIGQALRHVAELERLAEIEQQIRARRRRLTEFRGRLPGVQRQLSAARQAWCEALTRIGLPETVHVREALDAWRQVARLHETRQRLAEAAAEHDRHRQILAAWRNRIARLGKQLHGREPDAADPVELLVRWGEDLDAHRQRQVERRRLRREEHRRRREARQYQRKIAKLETRRAALLVQGGAATREEFEQRAEWMSRRRECEELLELAQIELDTAAGTEPDLAIVEEDLLAFNAAENAESLEMINLELEDLQREVHSAFEELGRLKQELQELETDRRPVRLRFEKAQIEAELIDAARSWCAVHRAGGVLDRMRAIIERTCQPETLSAASRHLERLTAGRFRNVWTPLGERRLLIDDAHGRPYAIEELSGGTREQLFLAVRLATIEKLSKRGLSLPIVFDDVLVNFDQARTEAAVDALLEFADGRQVLFFTCHLHLARLFQERGVEPVWLPGQALTAARERRAG